ncbi:MAG: DUF559 domain-containing protein [Xanthobacteraceae bacterium]
MGELRPKCPLTSDDLGSARHPTSPRLRGEVGEQSEPGEGLGFNLSPHAGEVGLRSNPGEGLFRALQDARCERDQDDRARRLRRNSTNAETRLWNRLRSRAVNGYKIVRQEPIGPYVVDFICRERRLVIEVDGGQHATDKRDAARDAWLKQHSYRVVRFWNNEVLENIDGVLETIAAALAESR